LGIVAQVPTNAPAGWPTPFNVVATSVNTALPVSFKWNFGDGSATGTNQFATHVLASPGIYSWQVVATVGGVSATNTGSIAISAPVALAVAPPQNSSLSLSWPISLADVIVEQSDTLGTAAAWTAMPYLPVTGPDYSTVTVPIAGGNRFFRVRQSW
jgi:PKD repeat protein